MNHKTNVQQFVFILIQLYVI